MSLEIAKENCAGPVNTVEIGYGPEAVNAGGQTALPFLFGEGEVPNAPLVALEVLDCEPLDWPDALKKPVAGVSKDPIAWAKRCVEEFGVNLLCVRLQSVHQDWGSKPVRDSVKILGRIAVEAGAPLVVLGCGDDDLDNELLPKASESLKGKNCLFGIASQNNYKTLTATCLADGHSLIAESPIDVNIAKQLNILISDMGFDPKRIVMHPTTTSLGYGMEYVYSIMERARLASFQGDRMLAMPFIVFPGQETWKVKEAKDGGEEQGVNWELATSVAMLQSGADIVVVRHPDTAKALAQFIKTAMGKAVSRT